MVAQSSSLAGASAGYCTTWAFSRMGFKRYQIPAEVWLSTGSCQGSSVSGLGMIVQVYFRMEEAFPLVLRAITDLQLSHPEMAQRCLARVGCTGLWL